MVDAGREILSLNLSAFLKTKPTVHNNDATEIRTRRMSAFGNKDPKPAEKRSRASKDEIEKSFAVSTLKEI